MTTFLGARAGAGGEWGVVRVLGDEHPERLAGARATRPRNSRRFIHVISRRGAVPADARTAARRWFVATPLGATAGASDARRLSPLASHLEVKNRGRQGTTRRRPPWSNRWACGVGCCHPRRCPRPTGGECLDRKSTRLNSSHLVI